MFPLMQNLDIFFLKTLKRKRDYLEKVSEGEMRTREGDEVYVIKMLYAYMKMLQ